MMATTSSGFYWNDEAGNSVTSFNAVNPSSIVPITSVYSAYMFSIPNAPTVLNKDYSFGGMNFKGYTF
jgi:hypothetical protein